MGTWSWGVGINGGNQIFGKEYKEEDLRSVFEKGIKEGFTLWDTAAVYGYGASETILVLNEGKWYCTSGRFIKSYEVI